MEKRIELEKRGRPANQVTELILDNCRSTNIVGLTDEFRALETLSLINIGLTTLKGFPALPSLCKLELSDNRVSNGLSNLATSPKLTHLNLSGNKIKDLDELKALESFQSLHVLDLFNNEITAIDSYREKIFAMIPSLKYLDGFDINDEEALSDGDDEDENGLDFGDEGRDNNAFSINGLEFDLDELDRYEQRLNAKRLLKAPAKVECGADDEADDLDEYLNRLVLEDGRSKTAVDLTATECSSPPPTAPLPQATDQSAPASNRSAAPVPFPVLLYWMVGLLVFVSSVTKRPTVPAELSDDADEDDDDDEDEEGDDDEGADDEELSLAEVYNEHLEEDNSDYVEEGEDEEEDDEVDSDEEDAVAPADANAAAPEQPGEEESATRGKKRKHDD